MRILVESLKRLYESKKIDKDKLQEMKNDGKISEDEFDFIILDN